MHFASVLALLAPDRLTGNRIVPSQTKTSKKEIKSALEIFQRELRGSVDGGNGSAGVSGGGSSGIPVGGGGEAPQKTFTPVPPAGVQNMAALYLKVVYLFVACH